ncbi:MAG TPA: hypothetical protein VMG38_15870 [Trebonia sp.]|nr:hypothetical protein [Trebonia sp.]
MESSLYAHVEDLRGEGIERVADRALGWGCDGLTVAAAYHRARDVTPHGSSRVTLRRDGVHFPLPLDVWSELRLVPPLQDGADDGLLARLRLQTARRGASLHGWTVFLHNTTLGLAHPDVTQENCFGDRAAPADLCPSHPDVRAYAIALARSVARLGVDAVVAESLHFGFFGHGYHHDRCFADLGQVEEFLLGLCFCPHCRLRAAEAGVDSQAARVAAARIVGGVLDGGPPVPGQLAVASLADHGGPALERYAISRAQTVTSLVASVARAVADEGSRLVFLDLAGAIKGYADGLPAGGTACEAAWQIGVDPAAIGSVADGYAILGYARDPGRLSADVAAYRLALGQSSHLRVTLRPGQPDTPSTANLGQKLRLIAAAADAVDFYSYGLLPLPVLDRIPEAISPLRSGPARG